MSDIETNLAFYQEAWELEQERTAALATKAKDPERWQQAKHAYAEWRTGIKQLAGRTAGVSATVEAQTAVASAKAKKTGR